MNTPLTTSIDPGFSFSHNNTNHCLDNYVLHCHNYYEIYYFVQGDVDYLVEGHHFKLRPHSLLLLSPHVFHGMRINSEESYERYILNFRGTILSPDRRNYLLSVFPNMEAASSRVFHFFHGKDYHLDYYFRTIESLQKEPEEKRKAMFPIYMEALLYQIMVMQQTLLPQEKEDTRSDLINDILSYLNVHLTEDITLDMITSRFCLTRQHLNQIFRKATGTTVFDYLLRKRIVCAQQALLGGLSASEAAGQAGFKDYSSFYRSYKKVTGHTPAEDRGSLHSMVNGGF